MHHADPYAWNLWTEELAVLAALAGGYVFALRRHPASRERVTCFALALALLLAVFVTPVHTISMHYLLSAHLLQNVVLAEWAPALLVLGVAPSLAARLARLPGARLLTHPLVALPLWLGVYFVWHLPWAYDTALEHPGSLIHLEHACYLGAGCLVWWPVLQDAPHRLGTGRKAIYVFGAFVLASPLGLLLALLPTPIYDFYEDAPRLWGLTPISDQQIAGVTMAAEQAVVFFVACAVYFTRFLREEEARGVFRPSA
jgi:putative membrane protein